MTSARLAALAVATREVGKTIQFERGLSDEVAITCAVVIDRAADVVAEHERVEALRRLLPCPTCGGTGWVVNDDTGYTVHAGYKCNECPDGFMPWERIVAIVVQLFAEDFSGLKGVPFGTTNYDAWCAAWRDAFECLRSVRP